jgi:hypothetical protein
VDRSGGAIRRRAEIFFGHGIKTIDHRATPGRREASR